MKNKDYLIILAFVALFLASAIIFKVYDVEILPSQFYGALIGVFITAIVTAFLLRGQTAGDEKREKSVKAFEEKLLIYKAFFSKLQEIVKTEKIDDNNVKELIFQISHIAMHTHSDKVNRILELLKITIAEIDTKGKGYKDFANSILGIMLELQETLYDKKLVGEEEIKTELFNELIKNIEKTADEQAIAQSLNEIEEGVEIQTDNLPLRDKVMSILSDSDFLKDKIYKNTKGTLWFGVEGREKRFQICVTRTGNGYIAIRNRDNQNDKDPFYVEMVEKIGFSATKYPWFGTKHFKTYGTKNANELATKIKEDIETFIKNLK